MSIQHLVINVETPKVAPEKLIPRELLGWMNIVKLRLRDEKKDVLMNPHYVDRFLARYLETLLEMSHYTADFGAFLYERVGTIHMYVDGVLPREWDLAEGLAKVEFDNSFANIPQEQRLPKLNNWIKQAYKTRVKLGLPVLPRCEQESATL